MRALALRERRKPTTLALSVSDGVVHLPLFRVNLKITVAILAYSPALPTWRSTSRRGSEARRRCGQLVAVAPRGGGGVAAPFPGGERSAVFCHEVLSGCGCRPFSPVGGCPGGVWSGSPRWCVAGWVAPPPLGPPLGGFGPGLCIHLPEGQLTGKAAVRPDSHQGPTGVQAGCCADRAPRGPTGVQAGRCAERAHQDPTGVQAGGCAGQARHLQRRDEA